MVEYYLPPYLLMSMTDEQKQAISDVMRSWEVRVDDLSHKNRALTEQVADLQTELEMFSAEREELVEMMARFQGTIMEMAHNSDPLPDSCSLGDHASRVLYAFKYNNQKKLSLKTISDSTGISRVAVLMATSELSDLNLIRCSSLDDILVDYFQLTDRGALMLERIMKQHNPD